MNASLTRRFSSLTIDLFGLVLVVALAMTLTSHNTIRGAAVGSFLFTMIFMVIMTQHYLRQLLAGTFITVGLTAASAAFVPPVQFMEVSGRMSEIHLWQIVGLMSFGAVILELLSEGLINYNQSFNIKIVEKEVEVVREVFTDLLAEAEDMTASEFWENLKNRAPLVYEGLRNDFQTMVSQEASRQLTALIGGKPVVIQTPAQAQITSVASKPAPQNQTQVAPTVVKQATPVVAQPIVAATPKPPVPQKPVTAATKVDDTQPTTTISPFVLMVEGMIRAIGAMPAANADVLRWIYAAATGLGQSPAAVGEELDKKFFAVLLDPRAQEAFSNAMLAVGGKAYKARKEMLGMNPILAEAMRRAFARAMTPEQELLMNFIFNHLHNAVYNTAGYTAMPIWSEFLRRLVPLYEATGANLVVDKNSKFSKVNAPAESLAPVVAENA